METYSFIKEKEANPFLLKNNDLWITKQNPNQLILTTVFEKTIMVASNLTIFHVGQRLKNS